MLSRGHNKGLLMRELPKSRGLAERKLLMLSLKRKRKSEINGEVRKGEDFLSLSFLFTLSSINNDIAHTRGMLGLF